MTIEIAKNSQDLKEGRENDSRFDIGLAILIFLLSAALISFLLYLQKNILTQNLIIGFALILLAILAYFFAAKPVNKSLSLLLVALSAIIVGGLNGGLFGIGAGAIFWPPLASWLIKAPRRVSIIANIMTFIAITIMGLASGNLPSFENPILPSILSLGLSAFILNLIFNFASSPLFQKQALEEIKNAKDEVRNVKTQLGARTNFIAELSHEIRTPLNHILGFSEIMKEEVFGPLNPKYKEYSRLIHDSGRHLNDLVGDILDMSKIEAGRYKLKIEEFDLSLIAKEAFDVANATGQMEGHEMNFFGAKPININSDKRAIKQIILNLLSNSIKYTPKGGKINLRVFGNAYNAWLEVEDNGKGMSQDELRQIGNPYLNAQSNDGSHRSTGLGLALVKNLSELLGGEFKISSVLNQGTKVTINIPNHIA